MVGINVGIPVPVGFFPFSGHKDSFFGESHCFGADGIQLLHRDQVRHHALVLEADRQGQKKVSTWDGTVNH